VKILLRAFGGKLEGYMEIKNPAPVLRLRLAQPTIIYKLGKDSEMPFGQTPFESECVFETTGKRMDDWTLIYELTNITKTAVSY